MDSLNVLSRRSLLKASSFLTAFAVASPVAALVAPTVPEVLTLLLREYADAAENARVSHDRFNAARHEKEAALHNAHMFLRLPHGKLKRIGGDRGYHPENMLRILNKEEAIDFAALGNKPVAREKMRAAYDQCRRDLAALTVQYEAVENSTDWPNALEFDRAADLRFRSAKQALLSYRPETMPEVAALLRGVSEVGPYVGFCNGLTVRDLADMLDGVSR
tara:strand:- start:1171 stop:1827 length:657 start_codon:yes stop_codon:yes gene_type:complete